jgi:hypothetical protein
VAQLVVVLLVGVLQVSLIRSFFSSRKWFRGLLFL